MNYTLDMLYRSALPLLVATLAGGSLLAQEPASFAISGDWDVRVFPDREPVARQSTSLRRR